jgi:serine beta-lactamase-like protein LACTB
LYLPGFLHTETMQAMWTPQPAGKATNEWGRDGSYGMGWKVVPSLQEFGGCDAQKFAVGHDGGAVGASSVLLVVPTNVPHPSATPSPSSSHKPVSPNSVSVVSQTTDVCIPCGVVVAIISNLQGVGLQKLAIDIAAVFCEAVTQSDRTNPYV